MKYKPESVTRVNLSLQHTDDASTHRTLPPSSSSSPLPQIFQMRTRDVDIYDIDKQKSMRRCSNGNMKKNRITQYF